MKNEANLPQNGINSTLYTQKNQRFSCNDNHYHLSEVFQNIQRKSPATSLFLEMPLSDNLQRMLYHSSLTADTSHKGTRLYPLNRGGVILR